MVGRSSQAAAAPLQAAATAATGRPGVNSAAVGDSVALAAGSARFARQSTSMGSCARTTEPMVCPALSHAGPMA